MSDVLKAIAVTAELTGTELSKAAILAMEADLSEYPVPAVLMALTRCRRELTGRLSLAAVIDRLEAADGRPSANEAWGIALTAFDEAPTVVMTSEIASAMEASQKHQNIDAIIRAIASNQDQIAELKRAVGVSTDTPSEIIKRLEQLVQCSVDPVITLDVAVRLAEVRPIEFYTLTNEIPKLTGLGMDVKKPKASGTTQKSEG